ncbi:DUF998 domain-containing protein [Actinoplanes sp. NPDC051470]|uniref:DUF998 domain-containing protein n=1 Tax=unclassified Actinoplanes TaxID=2626549 RepID=UPI00341816C8
MTTIATTARPAVATRTLLTAGAVAAPLWAGVSLTQAFTRDGFDLTKHPLSLLSTGTLGWPQITNFVVAGILLLAGAAGLRRTAAGPWTPRLVATSGLGMIAAGLLVMDPGNGFPAGVTAIPTTMTWHSIGHMVAGTITFTALIAACYVLARRNRSVPAAVAGTALLIGDVYCSAGGKAGSLTLAIGAITAMLYISYTAARHRHAA